MTMNTPRPSLVLQALTLGGKMMNPTTTGCVVEVVGILWVVGGRSGLVVQNIIRKHP